VPRLRRTSAAVLLLAGVLASASCSLGGEAEDGQTPTDRVQQGTRVIVRTPSPVGTQVVPDPAITQPLPGPTGGAPGVAPTTAPPASPNEGDQSGDTGTS